MSSNIRLNKNDLNVGMILPWSVYDSSGLLLLKKGTTIASERQIESLIKRGLYRHKADGEDVTNENDNSKPFEDERTPFEIIYDFAHRLTQILSNIELAKENSPARVQKLCTQLQQLCTQDADATLGAVHLCFDYSYSILHSIHVAILCELLLKRLDKPPAERLTVMAAALTSNIAMRKLQDELQNYSGELSENQRQQIKAHPSQAVTLLRKCGVEDTLWLTTVAQHHECLDGSGYPGGLSGEQIIMEAQVVGLADRYTAMVSGRSYRDGIHAKEVLRSMFLDRGGKYDESLAITLIKELGVYPPGACVKLKNGEQAIIIKRGKDANNPTVASILSPRGGPYSQPLRRVCGTDPQYEIIEIRNLDRNFPLNLSLIWGLNKSGN